MNTQVSESEMLTVQAVKTIKIVLKESRGMVKSSTQSKGYGRETSKSRLPEC